MDADRFDRIKQRCENQQVDARRMRDTASSLRRVARAVYREVQEMRATARGWKPAAFTGGEQMSDKSR
jgi:hypothetical protein